MAISGATLELIFQLRDEASAGMSRIAGEAAKLDTATRTATGGMSGFAGAIQGGVGSIGAFLGPIGLATAGIGSFTAFLGEAGKAAVAQEVDINRLNVALTNNVQGWSGNVAALDPYINKMMQLAFSDDQVRDSLGVLVNRTHDLAEAQNLQAIAMDLARGKNIDLATAAEVVGKVSDGTVGILARYGIAVQAGASATQALGAIQSTYAGQAEAYGNSTQGALDKMHNAFSDAMETIGTAVLPLITSLATAFASILPPIANLVSFLLDLLKPAFDAIGFVITALGGVITWIGGLFDVFSDDSSASMQLAASNTASSLSDMQTNFTTTGAAIQDVGRSTGEGYGYNLSNGIYSYQGDVASQVSGIQDTVNVADTMGALGYSAGSAWTGTPGGVLGALNDGSQGISQQAANIVNGLDQTDAAGKIGYQIGSAFFTNLQSALTGGPSVGGQSAPTAVAKGVLQGIIDRTWQGTSPTPPAVLLPSQIGGSHPPTLPNYGNMTPAQQEAAWKAAHPGQAGMPTGNGYNPDEGQFQVPSIPNGAYPLPVGSQGAAQYMASDGTFWPTQSQATQHSAIIESHAVSPTAPAPPVAAPHGPKSGGSGSSKGSGGSGSSSGSSAVESAIQAAADMTSKISSAVQAGIAALGQLSNFTLPSGFTQGVDNFAQGVNTVMQKLQQVAINFKDEGLAHILAFVDAAQKGMSLVSTGVDAFAKLKDFQAPASGSIDAFVNAVQYVTNKLGDIAAKWSVDSLAILGLFADSTSKAMDMVGKAVDALGKLKDFQKPSDAAMDAFTDALDYVTDKMRHVIAKWDANSLTLAATFGESIGKLISGIGGAVDTLKKLIDFKRPTDDAIHSFFDALDAVIPKVSDRSRQWYGLINEGVSTLAGYVGTSVTGMLGAVDGFTKLAADGVKMPTTAAMDAFFTSLDLVVPQITERARTWYGLVNQSISEVAGYVGSAVTGLLGAIDGMTKLASGDAKTPSGAQINSFFDALDILVPLISVRTRQWYGLVNESIAQLSGYVGSTVTGVAAAIDPLTKLATFAAPPKENIDAFFDSLVDFITAFGQRAADFQGQASTLTAELATNIGTIAAGMSAAFDPLLKVGDVQAIDKGTIEGAMSNVWELLHQMDIVIKGFPAGFADQAKGFASSVGVVFDAIKAGFDVATSISGDTGGAIGAGLQTALTKAQDLVAYLGDTAKTAMSTFGTDTTSLQTTVVGAWDAMTAAVGRYITELGKLPAGTSAPPPKGTDGWNFPGFATGGIATHKQLAWVGENGPEAIIPLSKFGSGSGSSGHTFNVTINAGPGMNGTRLATEFIDEIEQQLGLRRRSSRLGQAGI